MPEAVCDTSPIQYLHQTNRLELLPRLYHRVLVPSAVVEELDAGRRLGVRLPDLTRVSWAQVKSPQPVPALSRTPGLGRGELEVIALTLEMPGRIALLDDAKARRHAEHLGLRLTGTLGILVRAKKQHLLERIGPLLDELDRLGFRISPAARRATLLAAGETDE